MKNEISRYTYIAIQAAISAGNYLRQGFRTQFEVASKEGKHNLVTEYDLGAEKKIISFIKENFPEHGFLAEESGATGQDDFEARWIIDPLDGTVNFAHGIPCFAVSIAIEKNKEIISGVVFQPMTNELFTAEKGSGAFFNGTKMTVTDQENLEESLLATGFPYNLAENPSNCIEVFSDILKQGYPLRRLGAAALDLCYVASGRFDGFFEVTLGPWDCAAGKLIVEEAGGKVTCWDNSPFDILSYKPLLATNGKIHDAFSSLLVRSK
ncbi:MAG: inositol monophosphatase [Chlamydiae bacterium CG10_big_fil_rev_8_21_14_0_10_35_9]|nr:MAG: inositol monophosphatase [Chlamydiae bacterium CG10_big_fil_rev_8_21_14_0_10_35_9]